MPRQFPLRTQRVWPEKASDAQDDADREVDDDGRLRFGVAVEKLVDGDSQRLALPSLSCCSLEEF